MKTENTAFGCIFCVTGKEDQLALEIMSHCPETQAFCMKQKKRKTRQGVTVWTETVLFPGYVFFKASVDANVSASITGEYILSILTDEAGEWQLYGEDKNFARWVFQNHGLIGVSSACREGNRIRMLAGPLKDYEAQIVSVDKRNQNGKVILNFGGKSFHAWLGYELVETTETQGVQVAQQR